MNDLFKWMFKTLSPPLSKVSTQGSYMYNMIPMERKGLQEEAPCPWLSVFQTLKRYPLIAKVETRVTRRWRCEEWALSGRVTPSWTPGWTAMRSRLRIPNASSSTASWLQWPPLTFQGALRRFLSPVYYTQPHKHPINVSPPSSSGAYFWCLKKKKGGSGDNQRDFGT